MKQFLKENYKKIVAVIFLLLFLLLTFLMKKNLIVGFDSFVYKYLSIGISDNTTKMYKFITSLCSTVALIAITIFIFIIFKNKIYGKLVTLNLINVVVLNQILKIIFSRERPNILMLVDEKGYSFPSGHAMVSTAFYGFLIYLIWHTNIKRDHKWLYSIILFSIIMTISVSRVYLGVHYASDVLAGFSCSLVYLIIYTNIVRKHIVKKD